MTSIGLIAEYNPFHNGHMYQLKKIKELYPDSTIILILSGNFTQRGDVSIIDKWKKTSIALKAGVDLVIELPFPFATQSADYFSYGAITLLEHLKVEKLVFGSESDNLEDLKLIASTQLNNEEFDKLVKIYSKLGYNYPTALSKSLEDLTGKKIDTPNDLLGVSYIKTILKYNYKIEPVIIKRINNYHEKELNKTFSSATSIREALKRNNQVTGEVPKFVLPYLNRLHYLDDYFMILKYKIITTPNLEIYQTVDQGFDKILKKYINGIYTIDELIKKIKSKKYTYNKINRMLLHILCNFKKSDANIFKKISYIRILGFNDKGRVYLNSVKKDIDIPIISKITKNKDKMLEFEINTSKIYDITYNEKLYKKEFQKINYFNNTKEI